MLNAESPSKPYPGYDKLAQMKSLELPPLQQNPQSPSPKKYEHLDFNHIDSPLKRSFSMQAIIHGKSSEPGAYYIDELQRFRRNHEAKNKEQRDRQKALLMQKLQKKRTIHIERQKQNIAKEQNHVRNLIEKNNRLLEAHSTGLIRNNSYNSSLPVNPINQKYENNRLGLQQKQIDDQARVRKLIRGHRMQTMGNSGYNVINGKTVDHIGTILNKHENIKPLYEEKLEKFYSSYKIQAQSPEQFDKASPAKKVFRYQ